MLFRRYLAVIVCALCLPLTCAAAMVFNFSGTLQSDGDVRYFNVALTGATIDVRTLSYGGWLTPAVSPGGFAPSISLYDVFGNQVAHDFTGGTATGATCSNGARKDPTTGFCQDATFLFTGPAGNYLLALSVQGNDGPDPLSLGYLLNPGQNFNPDPFVDPGDPTGLTVRNGRWAVQLTLDGSAVELPEPAAFGLAALGLAGILGLARRRR